MFRCQAADDDASVHCDLRRTDAGYGDGCFQHFGNDHDWSQPDGCFQCYCYCGVVFPQYSCKAAGFWTLLVGFIMLVLWQFVPAVRIFPNVIYMEWFACILTYAVVAVLQPGKKLAADTAE